MAMVLGIVMMLVTGGTLLATSTMQHDPLVQGDVLTHYAYRALEAGINSYLNTINAQPHLVNCSDALSASATCHNGVNGIAYDQWSQVPTTKTSTGNVPEWYLWTNPQFCFSTTKTYAAQCTASTATHNFQFVEVMVVGAAGTPGHYAYQTSVAKFSPRNGFLTHLWWSNYEAAPTTNASKASPSTCMHDWANGYNGPGSACSPVVFASGTHIDGPVFSNDSIYVYGTPTFGAATTPSPVETGDPACQFVTTPVVDRTSKDRPTTCRQLTTSGIYFTKTNSRTHAPTEKPPTTDSQLQQVAAKDGCVYSGPTTISFYATTTHHKGYMNVTSPETSTTGSHDNNNATTNDNLCVGTKLPLPTATSGNGVIYVTTATPQSSHCAGNGANPFDGLRAGQRKTTAQILVNKYNYTDDVLGSTPGVDCEGEVFVRDTDKVNTPSGMTRGIAGNLTVAAATNVVITGTLTYSDCGSSWNSESVCPYHPGTVNDSLGLIANHFVEVNRPVKKPTCSYWWGCTSNYGKAATGWQVLGRCSTTVTDLQAVLCNPAKPNLVVDAAVLDLTDEFAVNNYGAGGTTGNLVVYGTLDQYWRGVVGYVGSTGYTKYYTWDSRLQYVSIPYYLTPGTPSWALTSSSVVMSSSCPRWPKPYPTGAPYLATPAQNASASMAAKGPSTTTC